MTHKTLNFIPSSTKVEDGIKLSVPCVIFIVQNMRNAGLTRVPGSLGARPPKIRVSVGPPIFNVCIIFLIIYDLKF